MDIKQRTKELRAKYGLRLKNLEKIKDKDYFSSLEAFALLKYKEENISRAEAIKAKIIKTGLSPEFAPSEDEIKEINMLYSDQKNSLIHVLSSEVEELKKLRGFERMDTIYNLIKFLDDQEIFFSESYFINRARLISENVESPKTRALEYTIKEFRQRILVDISSIIQKNKSKKRPNALQNVMKNLDDQIKEFFPDLENGDYLREAISHDLVSRLDFVRNHSPESCDPFTKIAPDLFERLRNEEILYRDDMQKVYLTRKIKELGSASLEDFLGKVQKILSEEESEPNYASIRASMQRELSNTERDNEDEFDYNGIQIHEGERDFLRLTVNRHRNWLKEFFKK